MFATEQKRANTRRAGIQEGDLPAHRPNARPPTQRCQKPLAPGARGEEITARREPALVCLHALDSVAVAHKSMYSTAGAHGNATGRTRRLKCLEVSRITNLR